MFFRVLMGVERATRRRLLREKQQRKITESGVLEEAGALPAAKKTRRMQTKCA
ncbi:hypothetical protein P4619_03120 [Halalkalibacterium halodurans]|nr:hypothetical protein [Halalkalibacterium halodurans]MDY7223722.1 hypothetical protein [Halalkalibacterium halodurans]MDY7242943.1 hypothetical protein [Halalkalibacterium halodurans]MED4081127.1 hypothetical protein [Halalkalibacterium halodurans]MED4108826.1 hypothetical protein [Halalkalibacterium halodurans]MED4150268.1 hypothetical protein [Halalkalibacterium halodurans]